MDKLDLVKKYLKRCHTMQLATADNDQPWICTLHYMLDDKLRLYWASPESTSHSTHIKNNQKVALAIAVVQEKGQPVVGIQIQATAMLVPDDELEKVAKLYAESFGFGQKWIDKVVAGQTMHKLFVAIPEKIVLFDDISYPDHPRQEIDL